MAKNKHLDFLRCADCAYFGHHGAHCDLIEKHVWEFEKMCVFGSPKDKLQKVSILCFFPRPYHKDKLDEMKARGMEMEDYLWEKKNPRANGN